MRARRAQMESTHQTRTRSRKPRRDSGYTRNLELGERASENPPLSLIFAIFSTPELEPGLLTRPTSLNVLKHEYTSKV